MMHNFHGRVLPDMRYVCLLLTSAPFIVGMCRCGDMTAEMRARTQYCRVAAISPKNELPDGFLRHCLKDLQNFGPEGTLNGGNHPMSELWG